MINHSINGRDFSKVSPKKEVATLKQEDQGVFGRLGEGGTGAESSGIFNRLGKETKKELPYAGVLKRSATPPLKTKKVVKKVTVKVPSNHGTQADKTSIMDRLGPATSATAGSKTIVLNKKSINTQQPVQKVNVLNRLGAKRANADSTASIGEKKVINLTKTVTTQPSKSTKLILKTNTATKQSHKLVLKKRIESPQTASPSTTLALKRKSMQQRTIQALVSPPKKQMVTLNPDSLNQNEAKRRSIGTVSEVKNTVRKPISSNTVSSTSSAGIFKRTLVTEPSVFARLGKS